jgi:dsDNA-binding SOS-regulon protein
LMNEIDAWDKGLEIANDLGLKLDMKSWNKEKEEALITYLVL